MLLESMRGVRDQLAHRPDSETGLIPFFGGDAAHEPNKEAGGFAEPLTDVRWHL